MKKHYPSLFSALLLALAFAACENELTNAQADQQEEAEHFWSQFDFVIAGSGYDVSLTRVSTDGLQSTFEEGDSVGVYVVDGSNGRVTAEPANACYVVREVTNISGTTNETRQVLVPAAPNQKVTKSDAYNYIVYYPYNENMTFDGLKKYTHSVATDQSTKEAYSKSDLLWCRYAPTTASDGIYALTFKHLMARIIVKVKSSDVTDGVKHVHLRYFPTAATGIDMTTTGGSVPTYTTAAMSTTITETINMYKMPGDDVSYCAVVPAITIKSGQDTDNGNKDFDFVQVKAGENTHNRGISTELKLEPGHSYTFNRQ